MTDLDTIRERHNTGHFCVVNGRSLWVVPADLPCDTRVVLDALDDPYWAKVLSENEHLRADADRLAEALREVARENHDPSGTKWHHDGTRYRPASFDDCQGPDCKQARDALRQHVEP